MFSRNLLTLLLALCTATTGLAQSDQKFITVENAILKTFNTVQLSAQIGGIIESLEVEEGTLVTSGQVIGKIRDKASQLQVDRAKIAVERATRKSVSDIDARLAEKRLAVAGNELERAVSANQRIANTYPAKEVDRLQLVADSARLEIERANYEQELAVQELKTAQTELQQAEELLDRHRLVAMTDGIVTKLEKRQGEWVEPGTPLLSIVQTSQLRIEGFVSADELPADLTAIPAMAVMIRGETRTELAAKVTFVSPETNAVNSQVRIYLQVANPEGLIRPGMKIETRIGPLNGR